MSNALRAPSVGPIVGHTTDSSVRIWIRGNEVDDSRTVGIAAIYEGKTYVKGSAAYFRLKREYDRTGTLDFLKLKPNTRYTVRAASLSLDTTDPNQSNPDEEVFGSLPKPEQWRAQLDALDPSSVANFSTFPTGPDASLSFIFGSCRYPGLLWAKKRADVIFQAIHERFANPSDGSDPRFFMMVGDQIYSDTLPKDIGIAVADTEDEIRERYLSAFGAQHTRTLLRSVPTYMILDDHEIEDNWVAGRLREAAKRNLFNLAIRAYMSFQWAHCPRNYGDGGEKNFGNRLYYSFEVAGFPFFVLDGRTQRIRDDDDKDLTDNHLLGRPAKDEQSPYKGQVDELCAWLVKQQETQGDRPKFIVTASVFVPNEVRTTEGDAEKAADDSWPAFPNTRDQLLLTITDRKIQNVVFLSGDIHCSNVAEITFLDRAGAPLQVRAFSITSSAFYWPYPFADGDPLDYVHDSAKEEDDFLMSNGCVMRYKAWNFQQNDNFTQVDVDWSQATLHVRTFGKDGNELDSKTTLKLSAQS